MVFHRRLTFHSIVLFRICLKSFRINLDLLTVSKQDANAILLLPSSTFMMRKIAFSYRKYSQDWNYVLTVKKCLSYLPQHQLLVNTCVIRHKKWWHSKMMAPGGGRKTSDKQWREVRGGGKVQKWLILHWCHFWMTHYWLSPLTLVFVFRRRMLQF